MGKLIAKESSPICWQTTIIVNNDYRKELLLFSIEGTLDSEIQSNVSASKEANKAEQFWMYSLKQQHDWQGRRSKSTASREEAKKGAEPDAKKRRDSNWIQIVIKRL